MTNPHAAEDAGRVIIAGPPQDDQSTAKASEPNNSSAVWSSIRINPGALLSTVLLLLAAQNMLLWRLLNIAPLWAYLIAGSIFAAIAFFVTRAATAADWRGPSVRTLFLAGVVSLLLFLLGGEGRLFYANADWQVRDAILRDLMVYPWPFVYQSIGQMELLRAPIGMYLVPALAGKALGPGAADFALLIQNSLFLTLLLALGSTLIASSRARTISLVVLIVFSGMDIIGQWVQSTATDTSFPNHLERWAFSQYSSHITQAFWVPQHALAGWFGALLFLLWREHRISLGQMYMLLPMLMLLSPLGVMGMLPFAAYAGIATLRARELRVSDFLLPSITTIVSAPAILYLGAASSSVGIHLLPLNPVRYLLFELLEVLPYVVGVALLSRPRGHELGTLVLVTVCLLVMPFVQIGEGMDFTMRASIPALAILALMVASALARLSVRSTVNRPAGIMLFVTVVVGSVTGAFEVWRALAYYPSPRVQCSPTSPWYRVVDLPATTTNATYFAPVDAMPSLIRPNSPVVVRPDGERAVCWDRPWMVRRFHSV